MQKYILLFLFFITYVIYLYWRAFHTIPIDSGMSSAIFSGILLFAEIIGFFETIMFYMIVYNIKTPETPKTCISEFPDVDVFITAYNEPIDLLYKTLISAANLDYTDSNKVHVYLCDDGNRRELASMCIDLHIGYITRTNNINAKAGNLNNALLNSHSPYVVTLDADMIPMHDFLMKTVPFFLQGEKIGFVQLPQNFYTPDVFQYNLFSEKCVTNEQTLFFRIVQAGKSKFNAGIYAGSNAVLSREALNEIGGFAVKSLTEDFATGMLIQGKGYKSIYLNEVHSSGLSPETLEDIYTQRVRWARGVIQTFKYYNPLTNKGLNIKQKLMYFSSVIHWYFGLWRFMFLFVPILETVFDIPVLRIDSLYTILFMWAMYNFSNFMFKKFTNNARTTGYTNVYDTILFPQITIGALLETFGLTKIKFKVTPKFNESRDKYINKYHLVYLQIILAVLTVIGIVNVFTGLINGIYQLSTIIILPWLTHNLYLLLMVVFVASERPKLRKSERFIVKMGVLIDGIRFRPIDISESGLAVIKEPNTDLVIGRTYNIELKSKQYIINTLATMTYTNENKYVFQFKDLDENNYKQLVLLLHDRIPYCQRVRVKYGFLNIIKNIIDKRICIKKV